MKVAALTRYDRQGASSRVRFLAYEAPLARAGINLSTYPFFGADYLSALYTGAPVGRAALAAYARRAIRLARGVEADLVWLEKEAFPWLPWDAERWLLPRLPLVIDLDDAVFHRYDRHPNPLVRRLLGRKIDAVMAAARLVLAGNDYLAERARGAGARWVEVLPTVVDSDAYAAARTAAPLRPSKAPLVVGWIGTPGTWRDYMLPLLKVLEPVMKRTGARLRAVGAGHAAGTAQDWIEVLPWSEEAETAMIATMDVGLMPLDHSPWSQGKCGYKLIQYMACGLPVIASPVGVNRRIVRPGENGFWADSPSDWVHALGALLADEALRKRLGAEGQADVVRLWSLEAAVPRLEQLLRAAATTGRRGAP